MKEERQKEYISLREAADILGTSYHAVQSNVQPHVAHIKIGRRILLREEAFRKYLRSMERGAR